MQSKGKGLTAAQKRWYDSVASLGSIISGGPAVLHHPIGQRGKHNKQECGVWWIIPLTEDEHRRLHAGETFGKCFRKQFEKDMFIHTVVPTVEWDLGEQVPDEVIRAIMDYHL